MTHAVAGGLLVGTPILFNAAFAGLAARFDYPDVLRRPTPEVLARFAAGGTPLVLLWWALAMSAVLLAPVAVLTAAALGPSAVAGTSVTIGVLAAVVQFLGLVRWPFLVPYLARRPDDPAVDVVFQAFNRYLGVAVGEHLGYLFTGTWSVLVGVAVVRGDAVPGWLGVAGIVVGAVLAACSLEFVGPFEPRGWALAARLTPVAYVAWSVWLVGLGVALLL